MGKEKMIKPKKKKAQGENLILVLAIIMILAGLTYALSGFLTDWQWFKEVDYVSVFFTELVTKIKIGVPGFLIFSLLGFLVFSAFKASFLKKNNFIILPENKKPVRNAILGISGALGLFVSVMLVGSLWFEFLQFINATDFGITDPLFGNDIGFYMFKLDFLEGLANSAIAIVVAILAATVLLYGVLVGFCRSEQQMPKESQTQKTEADGTINLDGEETQQQSQTQKSGPIPFKVDAEGIDFDPDAVKDKFDNFKQSTNVDTSSAKAKF